MSDVVVIRSNSLLNDTRVFKISKSLSQKYSINTLGWNREGINTDSSSTPISLELLGIGAPIGSPSIIFYYPLFWTWILFKLIRYRPRFVHACDLDTALPALIYKFIFRRKMIFDVFDRFAMAYIFPRNTLLYRLINRLEDFVCAKSDALITVGDRLLNSFKKIPAINGVIMNCAEDRFTESEKKNDTLLKLVYTGNIARDKGLENVSKAIEGLNGIQFHIAGRALDLELLNTLKKNKNIIYEGLLSLEQASKLEAQADVLIALYNPENILNQMAMPNKLFISMMLGIPVITSVAREIIIESNHGIFVNYFDKDEIQKAIVKLRDDFSYRFRLGQSGRDCFLQKYNWGIMERKLFQIYSILDNIDPS